MERHERGGGDREDQVRGSRRGGAGPPTARIAAAPYLANAAALYGLNSIDQIRELRATLEKEKEKKKGFRAQIVQLQNSLFERTEQVDVLSSRLAHNVTEQHKSASSSIRSHTATAPESPSSSSHQPPTPQVDPAVSLRLRELERENSHLRSVAVTLQSQRDAFEQVARNLQAHSAGVELSFVALQTESQILLKNHHQHVVASTSTKTTLAGYESGLTHLLSLLAKQQEKIKR